MSEDVSEPDHPHLRPLTLRSRERRFWPRDYAPDLALNVRYLTGWVVYWLCPTPGRGALPDSTQGEALAMFPGRTAEATIQGAQIAMLQLLEGSDAESMANRVRRTSGTDRVEWDYPRHNAKIGPKHSGVGAALAHSLRPIQEGSDATEGAGEVTLKPDHPRWTQAEWRAWYRAQEEAKSTLES